MSQPPEDGTSHSVGETGAADGASPTTFSNDLKNPVFKPVCGKSGVCAGVIPCKSLRAELIPEDKPKFLSGSSTGSGLLGVGLGEFSC